MNEFKYVQIGFVTNLPFSKIANGYIEYDNRDRNRVEELTHESRVFPNLWSCPRVCVCININPHDFCAMCVSKMKCVVLACTPTYSESSKQP